MSETVFSLPTFYDEKILDSHTLDRMDFRHEAKVVNCLLGIVQIRHTLVQETKHCGRVLHKSD